MGGKLSSDGQQIRDKNELISVTLYPASRGPDYEGIIAAALSAAFGETVVTKQECDHRKDEPGIKVESLDLRCYEKMCYEPVKIQYGDMFGKDGDPITVTVTVIANNLPEQPSYKLFVGDRSYVKELKYLFEEKLGIPVDHSRLIFTFKGKQLEDGCRLSDYGPVIENSEMSITASLVPYSRPSAAAGRVLVLNPDLLSLDYDCNLTDQTDHDTVFDEGESRTDSNQWYRYALNVNEKCEDGIGTGSTASAAGEWPVSFHGTKRSKVSSSVELLQGYLLSKSQSNCYGRGICTSPSIEVAELYAEEFSYESKKYKVVLQNQVNSNGLNVIPADRICRDHKHSEVYWIQTRDKYIRPYGICVKKC